MGSGKSYEVVGEVILPALKTGRRVVSNIDGLDADAINNHIEKKSGIEFESSGQLVICTNSDVERQNFFPDGTGASSFCHPGDLICIDEAWRFFASDKKLYTEHKIFFREHRHFVNQDSKISCDLVLLVQDITDLHRYVKNVVELTFRTVKLKSVGMPTRYRIEIYEGCRLTKKSHTSTLIKKYNPEIFPLYSSYSGGQGSEAIIDERQSIFNNKRIWIVLFILCILVISAAFFLKNYFSGSMFATSQPSPPGATPITQTVITPGGPAAPYSAPRATAFSDQWRVTGYIQTGNSSFVIVSDSENRTRQVLSSGFNIDGLRTAGQVDGIPVTMFSGSTKGR